MRNTNSVRLLLLAHLILGSLTILSFNGTGDSGDSIYHFLYAKYAFSQPELFFDHWAKPLYVLLFSPFAQFGFVGVKILNLIFVNLTLFFTYKLSKQWFGKMTFLPVVLLLFCPLYFVLTFSGLTEPLFAFLLILSIYLHQKNYLKPALIILSFLPFVRSEGLLFILFFIVWEICKKNWISIFYLSVGTVFYSLAGYFVYQDFLWVFNKIPYATSSSIYGSGPFFHFFEQLLYVVGIPFFILIWIGLITISYSFFTKKIALSTYYFLVLSAGMFIIAHSLFWFLGIFNSMGLNRVLICIVPLLAIIASEGLNQVYQAIKRVNILFSKIILVIIILTIVLFPFSRNKAAINFEYELSLNTDQILAQKVSDYIDNNEIEFSKIYAAHPYIFMELNVNCFDRTQFEFISPSSPKTIKEGELIIWENWFSVIEQNTQKTELDHASNLELLFEISQKNRKGRIIQYAIYGKKQKENFIKSKTSVNSQISD